MTGISGVFVEHFSAMRAKIPDPDDPGTELNSSLIEMLMEADEILVAGEPGSHVVASTLYDIGLSEYDAAHPSPPRPPAPGRLRLVRGPTITAREYLEKHGVVLPDPAQTEG